VSALFPQESRSAIDTILEGLETDHVRSVMQYLRSRTIRVGLVITSGEGREGETEEKLQSFGPLTRQRTAAAACRLYSEVR